MPKDKSASRVKINAAMKAEFLEKGFAGASIRAIGERAGMTSAALYKHYNSKEDMFRAAVEPLINALRERMEQHTRRKYILTENGSDVDVLFGETFTDIVREVILPHRDEFLLLMNCSQGTKYENFLHDYAEENGIALEDVIRFMKERGYPAKDLEKEELHMLLSAYLTAVFEPIVHGLSDEKVVKYLARVNDFFMPGWKNILGAS